MNSHMHPSHPRRAGQQGFTLLEAIVAMLILTIGIMAAAAMQGSAIRSSAASYDRTEANNIAVAMMETLQHLNFQHKSLAKDTYKPDEDSEETIRKNANPYPYDKDGDKLELPDMLDKLVKVETIDASKVKRGTPCFFPSPDNANAPMTLGVVSDNAGSCYLLRWAVADAGKVTTDDGKEAKVNKHIHVFVDWNTPYGTSRLHYASIKYNNTSLHAGGN